MKTDELVQVIDKMIWLLETNQQVATAEVFQTVDTIMARLDSPNFLVTTATLLGMDPNVIISSMTSIKKIIETEKEFVKNKDGEKFIDLLTRIRASKLALMAISALL